MFTQSALQATLQAAAIHRTGTLSGAASHLALHPTEHRDPVSVSSALVRPPLVALQDKSDRGDSDCPGPVPLGKRLLIGNCHVRVIQTAALGKRADSLAETPTGLRHARPLPNLFLTSAWDDARMDEPDTNWSLPVNAIDGGYFLASFGPTTPPDEEWSPTVFPEYPGEVLAEGSVASVNILGSDEERVLLSCILLNHTPTQRELQSRIDQGGHLATFTLEAVGPIFVIGNDLEEQATLAPRLTSPIRLDCYIYMVLEPDLLYPSDPVEQHHLRMWPADGAVHVRPWWMG